MFNYIWYFNFRLPLKIMQCVFFTFNDNLFALSHSAMANKSLLTQVCKLFKSVPLANKFVPSAKSNGMVFTHAEPRSIIYIRKSKEPSMDLCGTLHLINCFFLFTFSICHKLLSITQVAFEP